MFTNQKHFRTSLLRIIAILSICMTSTTSQAQGDWVEQRYTYFPQWPVESSDRTITCTYDGHGGDSVSSAGLDIWSSANREIRASMGGKVISSGWNSGGYGNWVVIETYIGPVQYRLIYAHMRETSPWEVGWEIDKGQFIGYMGNTGNCTPINGDGTHLHFEVDRNGAGIDPQRFLSDGVIEIVATPRF